jgi:hypothetical protein
VATRCPIAGDDRTTKKVDALIRLEVACRLAVEALPALPDETEQALRHHVQTLCDVTGAELDAIRPGWRDGPARRFGPPASA